MTGAARRRPRRQGAAGQGGRGARRLHRLGRHRDQVPQPDVGVEGRRPGAQGRRRRPLEALPRRPGHLLRRPRRRRTPRSTEEFAANAVVKKAILVEAEALLPITDLAAAKKAFRDIAERWDAAGKVPRDQIKPLEARIRKVEQEIRGLEDDQWKKSTRRSRRAPTAWSASCRTRSTRSRRPGEGTRGGDEQEGQGPRGRPRVPAGVPGDGGADGVRVLLGRRAGTHVHRECTERALLRAVQSVPGSPSGPKRPRPLAPPVRQPSRSIASHCAPSLLSG